MLYIKNAINSVIEYWKREGDNANNNQICSDEFLHLSWLSDRLSFEDALLRMMTQ